MATLVAADRRSRASGSQPAAMCRRPAPRTVSTASSPTSPFGCAPREPTLISTRQPFLGERRCIAPLIALVTLAILVSGPALGQSQRPLTVDDLFKLEEIGSISASPDGQWLSYVLKRPRAQAVHHKRDYLNGNDRADVWVISAK